MTEWEKYRELSEGLERTDEEVRGNRRIKEGGERGGPQCHC